MRDWIGVAAVPGVGAVLGLLAGLALLVTLLLEGAPLDGGGGDPLLRAIPLGVLGGLVAGVMLAPVVALLVWAAGDGRLEPAAVRTALGAGAAALVAAFTLGNGGDIGPLALPIVLPVAYAAFWLTRHAAGRVLVDTPG